MGCLNKDVRQSKSGLPNTRTPTRRCAIVAGMARDGTASRDSTTRRKTRQDTTDHTHTTVDYANAINAQPEGSRFAKQ